MDEMTIPDMDEDAVWRYTVSPPPLGLGIDIARSAVRYAHIRREIAPTKIGRRHFFSRQDVIDWIQSCKVDTDS